MFGFKKKKEYDPAADWPHLKPHPLRGYTNFGMFEVHGTNPETGRSNKVTVEALDSSDALRIATDVHGLSEPLTAQEVQRPMATERQISYGNSLGISITPDMSMVDASAVICRSKDGDSFRDTLSKDEWVAACSERVVLSSLSGHTVYRSAMAGADRVK